MNVDLIRHTFIIRSEQVTSYKMLSNRYVTKYSLSKGIQEEMVVPLYLRCTVLPFVKSSIQSKVHLSEYSEHKRQE